MKIGEIKLIDNRLIKCIKSDEAGSCEGCCFDTNDNFDCLRFMEELGDCSGIRNGDMQTVIFVEL